jgi:hypothetical protein
VAVVTLLGFLLAVAGSLLFLRPKPVFHKITVLPDDPIPAFDHCVTWEGWRHGGNDSAEWDTVAYLWDGKEIGRGKPGFEKLLTILRESRPGSRILIYPLYADSVSQGAPRDPPWQNRYGDVREAGEAAGLTFIFSCRDHLGHLHPDFPYPETFDTATTPWGSAPS